MLSRLFLSVSIASLALLYYKARKYVDKVEVNAKGTPKPPPQAVNAKDGVPDDAPVRRSMLHITPHEYARQVEGVNDSVVFRAYIARPRQP